MKKVKTIICVITSHYPIAQGAKASTATVAVIDIFALMIR